MTGKHPLHEEIVAMATTMSEPGMPAVNSLVGLPSSDAFARAREVFLDVFVAQALDEVGSVLEHDKPYIAAKAAEYAMLMANHGTDLALAGIAQVRARLGIAARPIDTP